MPRQLSLQSAARGQRAKRSRQAGFTLTELMVALSGGLFLCIVVFTLSRDVSRFYQRETRAAGATLAGVAGAQRLIGDLALAGHLSTPNIDADPFVCNRPVAGTAPAALVNLRALTLSNNALDIAASEIGPQGVNLQPQRIRIAGAISVPEEFSTVTVAEINGTWRIQLDLGTASARRVGLSALNGDINNNLQVMTSLFMSGATGRIIRLSKGVKQQYVVAASVATAAGPTGGQAFINVLGATPLVRSAAGNPCGISDEGEGMSVSIINIIQYDIRSMLLAPTYQALFAASGVNKIGYEKGRAELARVELDSNLQEIPTTLELVSEYAVNLQFSAWRARSGTDPTLIPSPAGELTPASPVTQLVRGMHVRLSVRSREPDREVDVYGATATDLYRIGLGPGGTAPFARVRTLQSDVAFRNLEKHNW